MVRAAFLGCGPRAKSHAAAYELLTDMRISAICDLDRTRLDGFGDQFEIPARYDDFAKMVATEQPDLVHIVTIPALRVQLLTQACELGIPAVIVEKPLATDLDDLLAIEQLAGRGTKIVVNHQLRFHRRFVELLDDVNAGRIGPVRFIDGSCASRTSEQGSHVMNLLCSLNGHSPAVMVQGNCGGAAGLDGGPSKHPGPNDAWAIVTFENGVRASFVCSPDAPRAPGVDSIWMHKRVAAYGEAGHVEWSMTRYSKQLFGHGPTHGEVDYRADDTPAQAALTRAAADWLADDSKPHPTRLETTLVEAKTIMALYASCLAQGPAKLPLESTAALLPQLKESLHD